MINRASHEAMYLQIANIIREDILQGVHAPGQVIETHAQLAKRFGVSLITIRKAIDILIADGLLIARKGKGTFVAQAQIHDGFNRLTGMSTVIAMNNMATDVTVNNMHYMSTPDNFSDDVKEGLGKNCLYIERTHTINKRTIGFAIIYIPERYADQFTVVDVSMQSIYSLYENKLQIKLGKGIQVIRADEAGSTVAARLHIQKNHPVLVIERKSFSSTGDLIEFMTIYYKYTQYAFQVELDLFAE